MAMNKRIGIVGAGPGGLATAVLLAHRGFDVDIFEKEPVIGGRNARLVIGDFVFDTGPTMLVLPSILEEIVAETAVKSFSHEC